MRYDDPTGPHISVGYIRIPAADPAARRGVLFGNPGGPGIDAYSYFGIDGGPLSTFEWPAEIRNEWDLVAVQPRGQVHSTQLACPAQGLDDPLTIAQAQLSSGRYLRDACESGQPGYPSTMTTQTNAMDWESVRAALGYEKISIMGLSYGTYLGSAYASLYPQHTDRVVLDSAMDPNLRWQALAASQIAGYERALEDYFSFVAANDATYHMGDTPLKAYQYWSARIVEETGTNPTVTPPPAQVGDLPAGLGSSGELGAEAMTSSSKARVEGEGIVSRMLHPGATQAASGLLNATRTLLPAPSMWDSLARMTNGTLPPHDGTEGLSEEETKKLAEEQILQSMGMIQLATVQQCNENITAPDHGLLPTALWARYVSNDLFTAPNAVLASGMQCSGTQPVAGPVELDGSQLAVRPLQINATGDPQTVYSGRGTIAGAMGSHLVTVHGPGHGHVGLGNKAVDRIVIDYLRTGRTEVTDAPGYFEAR
ncbi:alpha/beta hydrolase [Corynebacterium liangguodongii]|uniref:Alpha/beta hydrolase n=2 Tax=Corynebacterium liangguodongii TaxID=2079535 RepID=A0A2S0WH00_9CORY|nr:alpha/beta hydrolase [Corynebacterium liangguodongii]PWB98993.1 alpha/beta hydrolase [Corynebacterium liangguodongii]